MTAFFIPGVSGDVRVVENTYDQMRRQVASEMGHTPSTRRILSVWTRRGARDCVTEVGCSDPLRGGTVMAIFDMGHHRPYVVWWQQNAGMLAGERDVLGPEAYSVLEFDA